MSFIDLSALGLASTPEELYADWLAYMQSVYPGYAPKPGNLENTEAIDISNLGADVAQTAVVVPNAIFRNFGTKLFGIQYEAGALAAASVQVTAVDNAGHTLPAGTQVTLGALGFQTLADLTIPNGSTTGTVTVVASAPGTAYNGATNPTELVSLVDWVSSLTALAPASGGVDAEDDDDYQNRLASLFRLIAPRPITAADYATMALSFAPTTGTDQQEIGRATAIDGYVEGAATFTVTTVSASPTLTVTGSPGTGITAAQGASILGAGIPSATFTANTTSSSPTLASVSSFTNVTVGALVSGTGIPAGTWIKAFDSGSSTITLSANATATNTGTTITVSTTLVQSATSSTITLNKNATASASGVSVTVGGTLGNERTVTVGVALADGTATNTDTKTALQTWLEGLREANFVVDVIDPTYTTVYVDVSVVLYPGFDPTATATAIQSAITTYLSPQNFNLPPFGDIAAWLSGTTVFYDRLVGLIQNAAAGAVDHVVTGSLTLGTSASPTGTSDLVLPGPIALPESSNSTVTVTVV